MGYKVKNASNLLERYGGYLAGNATERAAIFMSFWNDPQVKALWCIRGGYGAAQILPYLDFNAIKVLFNYDSRADGNRAQKIFLDPLVP